MATTTALATGMRTKSRVGLRLAAMESVATWRRDWPAAKLSGTIPLTNHRFKEECAVTAGTVKGHIRANVDQDSMILTDEHPSYKGIGTEFKGGHFSVNHSAMEYANRFGVHSNTAESFFALIKRGCTATSTMSARSTCSATWANASSDGTIDIPTTRRAQPPR